MLTNIVPFTLTFVYNYVNVKKSNSFITKLKLIFMRKISFFFAALSMCMFLYSCSDSSNKAESTEGKTLISTDTAKPAPLVVEEEPKDVTPKIKEFGFTPSRIEI